ncbi:tripartite tricarboxylate transporter substrate binding protein [Pigmentiphaga sp. GD03639]|uniref:Bug family tripartite tricarboxylate transporter substrate binding protein n=1 Tax=unclassified Pigmentiphaga TaxID=2626614 RepID=UPI00244D4D1A|nr:tripartite tricarboxylate transporter substrate binding protein [Pigmentiphaga sp. GD03639]MDH2238412.1 tripartite tricarboxylate transporter substrate binding protein [Pigmentiphaga sp. GD03639]
MRQASTAAAQGRRRWLAACAAALGVAAAGPAMGQPAWPARPVRIVVPYAPGGGVDVIARALAERLGQKWGRPVIVENKLGAASIIGADAVAKAAPDGHTLLVTSESTITSNPFLYEKLPYDAVRDLAPVSQLVSLPQMVLAHPSVKANSLDELVALAKARPDELNYASMGSGSLPHLLFEGLRHKTGIQITQVPYKGIMPAVTALLGGEVQLAMVGAAIAEPHIRAGKMKPLAIARASRLPSEPNVPTLAEAGYADIDPRESWFGLFATGGTPDAVIQRIHADVKAIAADPEFQQRFVAARGFDPVFSSPAAFTAALRDEMRHKERLIRLTGAKAD